MEKTKRHTKNTLVVNMFAGPSCGKSTWAAALFYKLKLAGYNVELLPEYAKELTWREDFNTLSDDQEYVIAKQTRRQRTVLGKVDVCITDSPILLGIVYGQHCSKNWQKGIIDKFNTFNNLNILIERNVIDHQFQVEGRRQTLEQAIAIDNSIKQIFKDYNIPYRAIQVNGDETLTELYNLVMESLGLPILENSKVKSLAAEFNKNLFASSLELLGALKYQNYDKISDIAVSILDSATALINNKVGGK